MKLNDIDRGKEFDFGRTSDNYAKFRDIYPQSMYDRLTALGIGWMALRAWMGES